MKKKDATSDVATAADDDDDTADDDTLDIEYLYVKKNEKNDW